jgi:hypothetical protein
MPPEASIDSILGYNPAAKDALITSLFSALTLVSAGTVTKRVLNPRKYLALER